MMSVIREGKKMQVYATFSLCTHFTWKRIERRLKRLGFRSSIRLLRGLKMTDSVFPEKSSSKFTCLFVVAGRENVVCAVSCASVVL